MFVCLTRADGRAESLRRHPWAWPPPGLRFSHLRPLGPASATHGLVRPLQTPLGWPQALVAGGPPGR
eukprot:896904-Prymnesium_polylepis.1